MFYTVDSRVERVFTKPENNELIALSIKKNPDSSSSADLSYSCSQALGETSVILMNCILLIRSLWTS